ncbi:MAG: Cna B-type domain-containing protein [Lachnospiraceae bacterium]|nr:Cna B-type domain-containing protein [Lachnospiraceae bacterium]
MNSLVNFVKYLGRCIMNGGARLLQRQERLWGVARSKSIWKRILLAMSCVIVFATTYMLILPAITLDRSKAATQPGMVLVAPGTDEYAEAPAEDGWAEMEEEEPSYYEEEYAPAEEYVQEADVQEAEVAEGVAAEGEEPAGETQEPPQEEPAYLTGILTAEGEDYTVTADVPEAAKIPEGAILKVDVVSPEEYKIYRAQAEQVVDAPDMTFARFFDIRFEVEKNGQMVEVEPLTDIRMTIDPGQEAAPGESVAVLHFGGEDAAFALKALLAEKLTEEELKDLLADGLSRDEFREFLEQKLTPEETARLIAESMVLEDLVKFVDEQIVEMPEGATEKPTVEGLSLEEIEQIIADRIRDGIVVQQDYPHSVYEDIYDLTLRIITGGIPALADDREGAVSWEEAVEMMLDTAADNGSGKDAGDDANEAAPLVGPVADTESVSDAEEAVGAGSQSDADKEETVANEAATNGQNGDVLEDDSVSEIVDASDADGANGADGATADAEAAVGMDALGGHEGDAVGAEGGLDAADGQAIDGAEAELADGEKIGGTDAELAADQELEGTEAGDEGSDETKADLGEVGDAVTENGISDGATDDIDDTAANDDAVNVDAAAFASADVDASANAAADGLHADGNVAEGATHEEAGVGSASEHTEDVTELIVEALLPEALVSSNAEAGAGAASTNSFDGGSILDDAVYADKVLLEPPYIMVADTSPNQVAFNADSFSIYGVVYTVDFEYDGFTWGMPGGSAILLSKVLDMLGTGIDINNVQEVVFSDPALIEVSETDEVHDWVLLSLAPFDTEETLTMKLNDGMLARIFVTDSQVPNTDINIEGLISKVEVRDGTTYLGGSDSPNPVNVVEEHTYNLSLTFSEDENDPAMQFPDTGVMCYIIPDGIDLGVPDGNQQEFDIVLGKKNTLKGNVAIYHPAGRNEDGTIKLNEDGAYTEPAYVEIMWNQSDKQNYKLLVASPRTTFSLHYESTTVTILNRNSVDFGAGMYVNFVEDPSYTLNITKSAERDTNDPNGETIKYKVEIHGTGNVKDVKVSDVMGSALTYLHPITGESAKNFTITYRNLRGQEREYSDDNIKNIQETDSGFEFELEKLIDGDTATIEYKAKVDFKKLGGKKLIQTTSNNTFTALDTDGNPISDASTSLDSTITYLDMKKSADKENVIFVKGDGSEYIPSSDEEKQEWAALYIPWTIIYNPDRKVDVEGSELSDTVYKGAKNATSYATDKPFKVTAYEDVEIQEGENSRIFIPQGQGIEVHNGWGNVAVTNYTQNSGDYTNDTLASWTWTLPTKEEMTDDEGNPLLDDEKTYAYKITYYTKVERSKAYAGYVGNVITEDYGELSRDGSYILPGITPTDAIQVHKSHVTDKCVIEQDQTPDKASVYTKWEITFDRRNSALERAVVEDSLPFETVGGVNYADEFVNETTGEFAWSAETLYAGERCVPTVETHNHHVVFRFYTAYDENNPNACHEGLGAASGGNKTIKITFWTKNYSKWLDDSALGKVTSRHINRVHLVLDGQEADHHAVAVPQRDPFIEKSVEKVGTKTVDGIELPVYRYTLKLNGVTDSAFDDQDNLVIEDEFQTPLVYVPLAHLDAQNTEGYTITNTDVESDERIVRTAPKADSEAGIPVYQKDATPTVNGKKITFTIAKDDGMKYTVKDEDGSDIYTVENGESKPLRIYGSVYEISYYLVLDYGEVKELVQALLDEDPATRPTQQTDANFGNTVSWVSAGADMLGHKVTASVPYDLKPISKEKTYDSSSELIHYTVKINPLAMKLNNGERYRLEDVYENMAVDFATMKIKTIPADHEDEIEWSYHNNSGVFWIPDEMAVTLEYDGWPVGKKGQEVTYQNTATLQGYSAEAGATVKIKADHEGSAASYSVRVLKYADDNMDHPLKGAVFQLFTTDDNNNKIPMQYAYAAPKNGGTAEEDEIWTEINNARRLANKAAYPTQENHAVGDNVYFATGSDGVADIMLSQGRDGVSLQKGVEYFLLEVEEPDGYVKEDIYWKFIIGDNNDYDNYVYVSDDVLSVSNASKTPALRVRKTFTDHTERLTFDDESKVRFQVKGYDLTDSNKLIYNKEVTYVDFMKVDEVQEDGSTLPDNYQFIISKLKPGRYTVTEVRSSAEIQGMNLDASVVATQTLQENGNSTVSVSTTNSEISAGQVFVQNGETSNQNTLFSFIVPDDNNTESFVDAEFRNVYTEPETTELSISKIWEDEDSLAGKTATFAVYADGEQYKLSRAEGGNADGFIVLPMQDAQGHDVWSTTVKRLPIKKDGVNIQWSVEEIGASYTEGANQVNLTGSELANRFTVTAKIGESDAVAANKGFKVDNGGQITFTNKVNELTTVTVNKVWADSSSNTHTEDTVYVDIYRTTNTNADLSDKTAMQALIALESLEPVLENVEIKGSAWNFSADLKAKDDNGDSYRYFALERSVAGYEDTYANSNGVITITNTPPAENIQGNLTIRKAVVGDYTPDTDHPKVYSFTLENSGKYLKNDGTFTNDRDAGIIYVNANQSKTITNVPLGTYILTEIEDSANVGGYALNSIKISVDGHENMGNTTEVVVGSVTTTETDNEMGNVITNTVGQSVSVVVTNTYAKTDEKTDFSFGKLWMLPNEKEHSTHIWPDGTSITMQVSRRKRGTTDADVEFGTHTYVIGKGYIAAETAKLNQIEEIKADREMTAEQKEAKIAAIEATFASISGNGSGNAPALRLSSVNEYHHYVFTMDNLDKYAPDGTEWEYYAVESSVSTTEDASFAPGTYGRADGIAAKTVDGWHDAATVHEAGDNGHYVRSALNRLQINGKVQIPVRKILNGWIGRDIDYSKFSFQLYYKGKAIGDPVACGKLATATYDATNKVSGMTVSNPELSDSLQQNELVFDVTDLLELEKTMRWWSDEELLKGEYTLSIMEQNPEIPGVEYVNRAVFVDLDVTYKWEEADLDTKMIVRYPDGSIDPDLSTGTEDGDDNTTVTYPDQVNVENTYDPGEVTLNVIKHWDDDDNRDNYREPISFTVEAYYEEPISSGGGGESGEGSTRVPVTQVWFLNDNYEKVDDAGNAGVIDLSTKTYAIDSTEDLANVLVRLPKYYNSYELHYEIYEIKENGSTLDTHYPTLMRTVDYGNGTITFTNKHEPETINVSIQKDWTGDGNDNVKRGAVKVRLKANYGEGEDLVEIDKVNVASFEKWSAYASKFEDVSLTLEKNWQDVDTWKNLPRYAPGEVGKIVHYTIEEDSTSIPLGYHLVTEGVTTNTTAEANGTAANTVKNEYKTVDIPLKKVWDDDGDRDGKRPTSVTMKLTAKVGDTTIPISDIKDRNNALVNEKQTVPETGVGSNEVSEWTSTGWVGLPKYYQGQEITYSVEELDDANANSETVSLQALGYSKSSEVIDSTTNTCTITNTRVPETVKMVLTKQWDDAGNQDGFRPTTEVYKTSVGLIAKIGDTTKALNEIYADGKTVETIIAETGNKTVSGSDGKGNTPAGDYTVTFKNLPKYNNHGQEIEYSVVEYNNNTVVALNGQYDNEYTLTSMSDVTKDQEGNFVRTFKNQHVPETINVKVAKEWLTSPGGTNFGGRNHVPDSVIVKLKAKSTGDYMDLDVNSAWASYKASVKQNASESQTSFERTLQGSNSWVAVEWIGVPKYAPGEVGQPLTYTVEENVAGIPLGYVVMDDAVIQKGTADVEKDTTLQLGSGGNFSNTYSEVDVDVSKIWQDDHNRDNLRSAITLKLTARLGSATGEEVIFTDEWKKYTDTAGGGNISGNGIIDANGIWTTTLEKRSATGDIWTGGWKNLPEYAKGQKVYYMVEEVLPNGTEYSMTAETHSDDGKSHSFTNTRNVYEVKSFVLTKDWGDEKNRDGKRPSPTDYVLNHVRLLMDGVEVTFEQVENTPNTFYLKKGDEYVKVNEHNATYQKAKLVISGNDGRINAADATNKYVLEFSNMPVNSVDGVLITYVMREINGECGLLQNNNGMYNAYAVLPTETNPSQNSLVIYGTGTTGYVEIPGGKDGEGTGNNTEYRFALANKHDLDKVNLSVEKNWSGDDNAALERPKFIMVQLYADNVAVSDKKAVLKEGSSYKATFTGLKHKENAVGVPIEYTVKEVDVPEGYSDTYVEDKTLATGKTVIESVVTNTYQTGALEVSKDVKSWVKGDETKEYQFRLTLTNLADFKTWNESGTERSSRTFSPEKLVVIKTKTDDSEERLSLSTNMLTFTLKHGEKVKISGLPNGATYLVEELSQQNVTDKFTVTAAGGTPVSSENLSGTVCAETGTIAYNVTKTETFTNTRNTKKLTINKTLANAIPDDQGDVFYFNVKVTGDDGEFLTRNQAVVVKVKDGTRELTVGDSATGNTLKYDSSTGIIENVPVTYNYNGTASTVIDGLPVGTSYEVTEVDLLTVTTKNNIVVDSSKASGTISDSDVATSFANNRKTGDLKISKEVESPVIEEKEGKYYKIDVTLKTAVGKAAINGEFAFANAIQKVNDDGTPDGENTIGSITFTNGAASIWLKHGQTVTLKDIPTDVTAEIVESGYGDFTKEYTPASADSSKASQSITANAEVDAKVKNIRKTGDLMLSKAVSSSVAKDVDHWFLFKVEIEGGVNAVAAKKIYYKVYDGVSFYNNVAYVWLKGGTPDNAVTVVGLPAGYAYAVTELTSAPDTTGLPDGIKAIINAHSSVFSPAGYYDRFDTAWVKTVTDVTGQSESPTGTDAKTFPGTVEGTGNVIVQDKKSSVAFTNTRKVGSLKLSKVVKSPFESEQKRDYYPLTVAITLDGEPVNGDYTVNPAIPKVENGNIVMDNSAVTMTQTVTFTNGSATIYVKGSVGETDNSVTIQGLPTEAVCTVTETLSDELQAIFVAPSYAYQQKSGTQTEGDNALTSVAIAANNQSGATVTNSRKVQPIILKKVSTADSLGNGVVENSGLSGAKFNLTPTDPTNSTPEWTIKLVSGDGGVFLIDNEDNNGNSLPGGVTIESGLITLPVREQAYYLTETYAPDGFNILEFPVEIEVKSESVNHRAYFNAKGADYVWSPCHDGSGKMYQDVGEDHNYKDTLLMIPNSPGVELPSTGGTGTQWMTLLGLALAASAGVILLLRKRRAA